jgi:hypothetical protein
MGIYGYIFGYMRAPKIEQLTKEIVSLIGELDEFKGRWAATGANRNTVKLHFRNLVNDGHLEKEGVGRGMRYRMRST